MFCTWSRYSRSVTFLKCICSNKMRWNDTADTYKWMESMYASVKAVTALIAPGPDVTKSTPGLPDDRA